jgi:hypothetical protein
MSTLTVDLNGTKYWLENGEYHRVDGPAREWPDGRKDWYINGKRHREDGPAVEWPNGGKSWYLNDVFICYNGSLQKANHIVVERGIPTDIMFGKLKLTQAKLLTATGTWLVYDNLPGNDEIGEDNG